MAFRYTYPVMSRITKHGINVYPLESFGLLLGISQSANEVHIISVLGLAVDFEAPGWSFLSRGNFRVMLGECADAIPAGELGDHSYYGYITVNDVDALYSEYQQAGAEFIQAPSDKPWGMREFGIRTIDGHRVMFGQAL